LLRFSRKGAKTQSAAALLKGLSLRLCVVCENNPYGFAVIDESGLSTLIPSFFSLR